MRLWPDTKEAAEPLRVALYDGEVGRSCLGATQINLSKVCALSSEKGGTTAPSNAGWAVYWEHLAILFPFFI